ncbi:uncharacterized protein [Palaemon carinicauda]
MLKTIIFLSLGAFMATASPTPVGLFEAEITKALQAVFSVLDPIRVPSVTDLHITTDHSSIFFSATDASITGLSSIACTKFTPPILTKRTVMAIKLGDLKGNTPSYTMTGEFEGASYEAAGVGEISISGLAFTTEFKTESYGMSPVSICIRPNTLELTLSADEILANFEGADEINQDIMEHAPALLKQIEDQMNAVAPVIESGLNAVLCRKI